MNGKSKGLVSLLLASGLIMGCADGGTSTSNSSGDGIYKGTGDGIKSEIVANVELKDSEIVDINIIEEDETIHIADTVYDNLPNKIIEDQNLDQDVVSGATYTSVAVLDAVEEAIDSAGLDAEDFHKGIENDYTEAEDEEYDVVIVGGGAAGLTAGIGLMTDDELGLSDSGLKVLLLDKLAYTGGSIRVSDGIMLMPNNTPYNDLIDKSTEDDDLIEYAKSVDENNNMNEPLFRKVLEHIPTTVEGLLNRGLYMPPENTQPRYIHDNPETGHEISYFAVRDPRTGESSGRPEEGFNYGSNAGSPWLAQSLENAAELAGVEIRTSATVEDLILDGDKVTGVNVKDQNNYTEYDVKAKKVIVATGLLGADSETMEKWSDEGGNRAVHFGCAGHQGDGHIWAEELGGTVFNGDQNHYQLGFDERLGHYGKETELLAETIPNLWVNQEGQRFIDENESRNVRNEAVRNQSDNIAYGIIDSENPYLEHMDYLIDRQVGWEADSLEELADVIDVDYDGLEKTIEEYNATYKDGKDDAEYGTLNENMALVEEGPYYAFQIRSLNNASDASVKVDENFKLLREDESTIDDLYYTGSIVVSNYGLMDGGVSHTTALTSGSYVANLIRDELQQEQAD